jgi:plastocyanin
VRAPVVASQVLVIAVFATRLLAGEGGPAGTITGRIRWTGSAADLSSFVIWVDDIEGRFVAPREPAAMNQKGLRFVPHVLVIQIGTTVVFPNADPVWHNVFSISEAKRFNLGMFGRGTIRQMTFDKPGVVELLCNVHLEMDAYIVVVKNPYFAQTSSNGSYQIAGVPAGRHRLRCWRERLPLQEQDVQVPENGSVTIDFVAPK